MPVDDRNPDPAAGYQQKALKEYKRLQQQADEATERAAKREAEILKQAAE